MITATHTTSVPQPATDDQLGVRVHAADRLNPAEAALWSRYQATRSVADRNALVNLFVPLVWRIANKTVHQLGSAADVDELFSAGAEALLTAVELFDPARGVPFPSFSYMRLRGRMMSWARDQAAMPRQINKNRLRLEQAAALHVAETGRQPTPEELAERLKVTPARVEAMTRRIRAHQRRDLYGVDEESTRLLPRDQVTEDSPLTLASRSDLREYLSATLPKRAAAVVDAVYFRGRTMREAGRELDVCESRASQLANEHLGRLPYRSMSETLCA